MSGSSERNNSLSPEELELESVDKSKDMKTELKNSQGTAVSGLQKLICLVFFMSFGPCLIMVNKTILRDYDFPFPITHTCYTSLFCASSVWAYVHIFGVNLSISNRVTFKFYMRNIMPIGFLQGATIVLGMTSYLYLSVSFVQMLKASTPVMIVIFLRFFRLETPTFLIVVSVLIICSGTVMSSYGEMHFKILGVLSMLSAQVAEALRLVFTQKLLRNLKFTVVENLYYVTPAAVMWVLLAAIFLEFPRMESKHLAIVRDNYKIFIIAGCLGIGVNTINSVVIKFTGSLMMKLLATARNASLILFNVAFMGEAVSAIQFCGYIVSLGGFILFNYLKITAKNATKNAASK
ncbi:hypothetical protein AAMO2058_001425600 [Amorphochlora amoebiformis]|eukprot:1368333-Amorphochlora_amoeboformis.AAC.1